MPCAHLPEYKSKFGVESYKTIYEFFINNNSVVPNKKLWVRCFRCSEEVGRLLACMHCVYVGCYKSHTNAHHHQHGHKLFVELSNGCIFCVLCKDYAYDREFDFLIRQRCSKIKNAFSLSKWRPSEFEENIFQKHKSFIKILRPTQGMRGIINLGKTCYMSCIMQALLHTTMLRDYFFADKHECHVQKSSECLVCHFARLFQIYYSGEQSSLILHEILYLVWKRASHMAGYSDKDAHEFFIVVLNLLHQDSDPKNTANSTEPCTCIIDMIFHGKMQSDLVCQSCSNISTRVETIMDISLDIPDPPTPANLYECLNHSMREETLSKVDCSTCNSPQDVTKQLALYTLPLVIVIQLKRFEVIDSGNKKKDSFVSFPLELDMFTYMVSHKNANTQNSANNQQISSDNQYSLYAVIEHKGTLDNGHYLAYIKNSCGLWYLCNDDRVQESKVEDVMLCKGYLLFYHKTVLDYA